MICGKSIKVEKSYILSSFSNLKAISWDISINFPTKLKQLKIPSKETSQKITHMLLNDKSIKDSSDFLIKLQTLRKENSRKLIKLVSPRARSSDLFSKLLAIDNPRLINQTMNTHWQDFWVNTELKRWSKESKTASSDLKVF